MAPHPLHPNDWRVSDAGLDLIKRFERFSSRPYPHPCGLPAIGYGHLLRPIDQALSRGVNFDQAEQLLREDVRIYEIYLNASCRVPIDQHEFDALTSLLWDIGILEYEGSTLRKMLHTVCKPLVCTALQQYGLPAITRTDYRARRDAEAAMFASPSAPTP
ncbi:MAG: lysozyme [Candidatus Accumulibacter propinquus]|jgi:lysozyme|uniref:lysozyme n=1 Tax=Candidatus Accumulibacter propinquus TaxID=2954380 RepID=UPI002FC382CE